MIKRIKFLGIPVADQDRALAFYTDKLGFQILTDQAFSPKQRWIELTIPGAATGIALFTPGWPRGPHRDVPQFLLGGG